jgi:NitT/TauT family transport system permease protein
MFERNHNMKRNFSSRVAPPLVFFTLFLALWYLVSEVILPPHKQFLFPRPDVVLTDAFFVWDAGQQRGLKNILLSLWNTTQIALLGLLITTFVGVALALCMSFIPWIARASWPYLVALQAAPIVALTPLIRALIDNVTTQRVLVVTLIAFFPITNATFYGLTTVPQNLHDVFTINASSRMARLTRLQIPHSLPTVFLGLRTSGGLAVVGAVVGDFYFRQGGRIGIGAQIDLYRAQLWGPDLLASIILASILGIFIFIFFSWLGRRVVGHWHNPTTR